MRALCSCKPVFLGGVRTGAREIDPGCFLHGEGSIWQAVLVDEDVREPIMRRSSIRLDTERSLGMWCIHDDFLAEGCPVCEAVAETGAYL